MTAFLFSLALAAGATDLQLVHDDPGCAADLMIAQFDPEARARVLGQDPDAVRLLETTEAGRLLLARYDAADARALFERLVSGSKADLLVVSSRLSLAVNVLRRGRRPRPTPVNLDFVRNEEPSAPLIRFDLMGRSAMGKTQFLEAMVERDFKPGAEEPLLMGLPGQAKDEVVTTVEPAEPREPETHVENAVAAYEAFQNSASAHRDLFRRALPPTIPEALIERMKEPVFFLRPFPKDFDFAHARFESIAKQHLGSREIAVDVAELKLTARPIRYAEDGIPSVPDRMTLRLMGAAPLLDGSEREWWFGRDHFVETKADVEGPYRRGKFLADHGVIGFEERPDRMRLFVAYASAEERGEWLAALDRAAETARLRTRARLPLEIHDTGEELWILGLLKSPAARVFVDTLR